MSPGPFATPQADDELARDVAAVSSQHGDFVLSNGHRTPLYFDRFLMQCYPGILRRLARRIADGLPDATRRVAGSEPGSVPLATAVSLETGLPCVLVRRSEASPGVDPPVEGEHWPGEPTVLVADILASGRHAAGLAMVLRARGLDVPMVAAVIDREVGAREELATRGLEAFVLFTETDLRRSSPLGRRA